MKIEYAMSIVCRDADKPDEPQQAYELEFLQIPAIRNEMIDYKIMDPEEADMFCELLPRFFEFLDSIVQIDVEIV